MIRLIAIDLDGTLVRSDQTISQANLEALRYAHNKGVKIVICTGRPYQSTLKVLDQIAISGDDEYVILFNGGQIRRVESGEIMDEVTLGIEDYQVWLRELQRLQFPMSVIDSDWVYEFYDQDDAFPSLYVSKVTTAPSKRVSHDTFDSTHRFNKFVVCTQTGHLQNQIDKIDPSLTDAYQLVQSYPFQLEILPQHINKGSGLKRLGTLLGISSEEMVAIGDEQNDLAMLQYVQHPVAMGNASKEIQQVAEYVTDTNDNDGVAQAIYHYL